MLKQLRDKKVQKRIYLILAIGILPPFIFWGISLSEKDNVTTALGVIDGHKVGVREYLNAYKAVEHQASFMFGRRLAEFRQELNLKGQAWDRILLLQYAKKKHIRASDGEVADWLSTQPLFLNKGAFDLGFYKRYVAEGLHSTPREFENEIRQMLIIRKIREKLKADQKIADADLKNAFARESAGVDLLIAFLAWEKAQDPTPIADTEIQNLYSIVKDRLTEPEKVKLKYIFVPKDAPSVQGALEDKSTIEDLASKFNLALKETSPFSQNDALPEFSGAPQVLFQAFTLPVGTESEWVKTEKGSYKIKVMEKTAEHALSLEESKETLKKIFGRDKAKQNAVKKLDDLKSKLASDFEKTAAAENLEVKKVEAFKTSDALPGLAYSENIQKALEGLKKNDVTNAIEIAEGAVLLKVTKVQSIDEAAFAKEKGALKERLIEERADETMKNLTEELRRKLRMDLEVMRKLFPAEE